MLSIGCVASMIGLELALIALIAAVEPALRGMSAGMLVLAGPTALLMGARRARPTTSRRSPGRCEAHILIALIAYGLLTVGAIVAVFALIQERRLHAARITAANQLFAPLETTEKLLIGVTGAGFAGLTLAIASGLSFVNNLLRATPGAQVRVVAAGLDHIRRAAWPAFFRGLARQACRRALPVGICDTLPRLLWQPRHTGADFRPQLGLRQAFLTARWRPVELIPA